ncbi:MAG: hypothetical protein KKF46_00660 [Nanoarchaeota archaeon]|nr:hypothetical protein [Nanoarchaeota archaeon]MBU1320846.1 hypothetical protein [Nanoarchaeota archaeon]MBU1597930.1 hypothetical protein [Nanoarchaeota archaeon]MBU2440936.1 hypothetical protein [Nanoarchaeota archaeon]
MKKLNKTIMFLVAIIALLFVTSCTDQGTGQDLSQSFIGGTVGLNTYLIEGMPPAMIHDAGTFPFGVGIVIENQGEADVGPGTDNSFVMVRLEGINPDQFGVSDNDIRQVMNVPLRGARRNFDGTIFPGEITSATFETLTYAPNIHGNTQFTIRADVCYDYETIATSQVCIKDDVLENIQDESICSLSGEKFPQNSGGPLHVTSLIENPMAENKIQVNFVVEHVGIGEFFGRPVNSDDLSEVCDFSVRNFNKYFVDIEVEPLSDSGLAIACSRFGGSNRGRIKLYQGAPTTISCVIERSRPSAGRVFQDLLNIRLRYRYGQFIETPIIIQDVSN